MRGLRLTTAAVQTRSMRGFPLLRYGCRLYMMVLPITVGERDGEEEEEEE